MKAIILRCLCVALLTVCWLSGSGQNSSVSIGTEVLKDKAVLWLKSTGNQGLLLPIVNNRSSFTGLNSSDEKGMVIFDSSDNKVYYWNGSAWVEAGGGASGSNQTLTLSGNTFTLSGSPASNVNLSTAAPATGQALVWNGSAWVATALAGDVTGAAGANQVAGLKGKVLPALPSSTQVLVYNGTSWVFQPLSGGTDSQDLTLSGTTLSLTNDATPVTLGSLSILNSVSGANITDGSIQGVDIENGTVTSNKLAQSSATNGQILKWNGTQWVAAADDVGGGATPTLTNGQILIGNGTSNSAATLAGDASLSAGSLTISNSAITSVKIADGSITSADLATGAVTSGAIADGTIAANDLNAMGATNGQILKYNGTAWVPAADNGTTYTAGTGISVVGTVISNTGDTDASNDIITTTLAAGDITGTFSNLQIAANAVTNAEIANVAPSKITQAAATSGQVLKWNGAQWSPAVDDVGGGATPTLSNGQILIGDGSSNSASVVSGDATLSGGVLTIANNAITSAKIADGTIGAADLNAMAATNGQVLKFNGSAWAPAADNAGISSALPSAQIVVGNGSNVATGVALSGDATITNAGALTIANGAVSGGVGGKITDASITSADLATGAVTSAVIANGSITAIDLNAMGAATGQILKYTGTAWVPASDSIGVSSILNSSQIIVGNASNVATGVAMSGDATILNTGALTISNGAVSGGVGGKITDASITSADLATGAVNSLAIADGSIAAADLNAMGATAGQVLQYSGSAWAPATSSTFSTLNVIPKGDGTGMVDSKLFDDGTNVGIGTATPGEALDIVGNINISAASTYKLGGVTVLSNPAASNLFVGENAGISLTSGTFNVVVGRDALRLNTTGRANVAIGESAQRNNTIGIDQVGVGTNSLLTNATGTRNTAVGTSALRVIDASDDNVAVGYHAGISLTTGSGNTFVGETADGPAALTNATAIGAKAFVSQSNSLVLGSINGVNGASSNTRVGIGTSTPSEALHVVGNLRFTGALLPNNLAGTAGQVLTSAGAGVAPTWTTVSGSALSTNNVIPKGDGVGQVASSLTDNGTVVSSTNDINLASTKGLYINSVRMLHNTGTNNIFLGALAGNVNTAINNTFIGAGAGAVNVVGTENVFVGRLAGASNAGGGYNTFIGKEAGTAAVAPGNSVFIGFRAGYQANAVGVTGANGNTFIGSESGGPIATGGGLNTFVGTQTGTSTTGGAQNTFIGRQSGQANTTGFQNTLLGANTDVSVPTISNATAVGNGATVGATNTMVFGNVSVLRWGFGVQPAVGSAIVVGTNGTNGNGASLTNGGDWTNTSDKNKKENFETLNSVEILSKVKSLPITRWNYKGEPNSITHIGPMAQDFYALFNTGHDDKSISTIDPAGVALLSIQELIKKIELLEEENQKLKSDKSSLEAKVTSIEDHQKSFQKDLEELKRMLGAEANVK